MLRSFGLSALVLFAAASVACSDDESPLPPPPPPPGPDCTVLPRDPRCPPLPPPPIDCTKTPTIAACQQPLDCTVQPRLPVEATTWLGDAHHGREPEHGAELVFDGNGNLLGVDRAGNVYRESRDGARTILAQKAVRNARAAVLLSTGELVIADSGLGSLTAVYPGGEVRTLVPHLDFPNGLEVDQRDRLYISELLTQTIRRYDPATGTSTVVARSVGAAPGTLAFSPDERTLYVSDAQDGSVRALEVTASGGLGAPRIFLEGSSSSGLPCSGGRPGAACVARGINGICEEGEDGQLTCRVEQSCEGAEVGDHCRGDFFSPGVCSGEPPFLFCSPPDPCEGRRAGQRCIDEFGLSLGACLELPGQPLSCGRTDSCAGLLPGDQCFDTFGTSGVCEVQLGTTELYCAAGSPCVGLGEGDRCRPFGGGEGVCQPDGVGGLFCVSTDPCSASFPGDPCESSEGDGVCGISPFGQLVCLTLDGCETRLPETPCTTLDGEAGTCGPDPQNPDLLRCRPLPPCMGKGEGASCTAGGASGLCLDDFRGGLYCQTAQACAGLDVGEVCRDTNAIGWGHCQKDGQGRAYCDAIRPCEDHFVGARCYAPYASGGGVCAQGEHSLYCAPSFGTTDCGGGGVGSSCNAPDGSSGTCVETDEGLRCEAGNCSGMALGGPCTIAGAAGVCAFEDGARICLAVDRCLGLAVGQACGGAGPTGVCADNGRGGTYCQFGATCAGATLGAECRSKDSGLPGSCEARGGGALLCEPLAPCSGKAVGEACVGRGGATGACEPSDLGGALSCVSSDRQRAVRALETDACGWVYVADAQGDTIRRYSPDGTRSERVATTLSAPISSLTWGTQAGGWKERALYVGVRGGGTLLELDLGVVPRKIPRPTASTRSPGPPTPDRSACLNISPAPRETFDLVRPRAYHDLAFSDAGELIGSDGALLVAVDRQDNLSAYAPVSGAEGIGRFPDGRLAVASSEGLVMVSTNGAVTPLAPGVFAYGVTIGPDERVYAGTNGPIYRIDPDTGVVEVYLDTTQLPEPFPSRNIEFDVDHSLMVIASFADSVYTMPIDSNFDPAGPPRRFATILGGGPYLDGLAIDACGNAYVPSFTHSALYRISPDGELSLYRDTELQGYGHGAAFGRAVGGWRDDALYLPQPYNGNTVVELIVGVPQRP